MLSRGRCARAPNTNVFLPGPDVLRITPEEPSLYMLYEETALTQRRVADSMFRLAGFRGCGPSRANTMTIP